MYAQHLSFLSVCIVTRLKTLGAGVVAQVVECLPGKCEAVTSNPSTVKKQTNKQKDRTD